MVFAIYLICLGTGLVFTIITLFMSQFLGGGDHGHAHVDGSGGHAEAGADASDAPGMSAFSPTMIAAFISAFGGFGIIFHQIPLTRSPYASAPLAVIAAFVSSSALMWVIRQLFKRTQSSSESKVGTLVGINATVISPIPQQGVGEIAYVQGGSRYTAPARTESGCAVAAGGTVRIHRVVGTQFYVVPV